jgi:hypothetical protein
MEVIIPVKFTIRRGNGNNKLWLNNQHLFLVLIGTGIEFSFSQHGVDSLLPTDLPLIFFFIDDLETALAHVGQGSDDVRDLDCAQDH